MATLQAIYIALAVFGLGVTIVDLFGALDHGSGGHDADGHDGHDGHDAGHHDADHSGNDGRGVSSSQNEGSVLATDNVESLGMARSARLARLISWLRTGVYFSLGAGATGLAALAMKLDAASSALWAAGAGVAIAAFVRLLRSFLRRDLDSSFRPEDFILEDAEVTVPVAPGLVGRAIVRKYGAQSEIYVRAVRGDAAFPRGARVRIIDYQEDCYLVEAVDEEHLVR